MKIAAIIACRMGSSRLPGKSTLPILGKPMIERMIERVRRSRYLADVMIATTDLPEDGMLAEVPASTWWTLRLPSPRRSGVYVYPLPSPRPERSTSSGATISYVCVPYHTPRPLFRDL